MQTKQLYYNAVSGSHNTYDAHTITTASNNSDSARG